MAKIITASIDLSKIERPKSKQPTRTGTLLKTGKSITKSEFQLMMISTSIITTFKSMMRKLKNSAKRRRTGIFWAMAA